jgi:hypothetical protein
MFRLIKQVSFLFFFVLLTTSCDQINAFLGNSTESADDGEKNIEKRYHPNGKLRAYYRYDDLKQKHGDAKFYDEDGKVQKSFIYEHGEKIQATSYYDNGQPLMEINYKNGVKDGLLKRFYNTGKVESETPYKEDHAGMGLKEYSKSGKLRTHYPELVVKSIDLLNKNGSYIIEVYFDKSPGRGTYYMGELTEGKYMSYRLVELEKVNYRGQLKLQPAPGIMIMEKLNFVGVFKTPTGNKYIQEKSFNLAIDNSF